MESSEILQIISVFLQYPDNDMITLAKSEELQTINNQEIHNSINKFVEFIKENSLESIVKNYVDTFDFNEKTNLYMTYSKLKDEKERGNILVKLKEIYRDNEVLMESDELPDYYPLMLEFMSIADKDIVEHLLEQFNEPINELREELQKTNSPYAYLIDASLFTIKQLIND